MINDKEKMIEWMQTDIKSPLTCDEARDIYDIIEGIVNAGTEKEIKELSERVLWLEAGSLCMTCGYERGDCISEPQLSSDEQVIACETYCKREINDERWSE